jgi:hypothetical protein
MINEDLINVEDDVEMIYFYEELQPRIDSSFDQFAKEHAEFIIKLESQFEWANEFEKQNRQLLVRLLVRLWAKKHVKLWFYQWYYRFGLSPDTFSESDRNVFMGRCYNQWCQSVDYFLKESDDKELNKKESND